MAAGTPGVLGSAVLAVERLTGIPWHTEDPFLFCVYHDDQFPAGNEQLGPDRSLLKGRRLGSDFGNADWNMYHGQQVPGFPKHPHRGFETVTVVRHGVVDHTDSLGSSGRFGDGDVQWMTAGNGISHSEMFPLPKRDEGNRMELFQIWLNLPRARKMASPYFKMLWSEKLPHLLFGDAGKEVEVTLVAGSLDGQAPPSPPPASWAAEESNGVAIWTLRMAPESSWQLPAGPAGVKRTLYCFKGAGAEGAKVGGRSLPGPLAMVRLAPEEPVQIHAGKTEAEFLMLQGRPIAEPVVSHGPFVMTSKDEIRQAFDDYQRTGFGGWPWPSDSVVQPREQPRFARYADGREELPGADQRPEL